MSLSFKMGHDLRFGDNRKRPHKHQNEKVSNGCGSNGATEMTLLSADVYIVYSLHLLAASSYDNELVLPGRAERYGSSHQQVFINAYYLSVDSYE